MSTPLLRIGLNDLLSDEAVEAYAVAACDHDPENVLWDEDATIIRNGLRAAFAVAAASAAPSKGATQ